MKDYWFVINVVVIKFLVENEKPSYKEPPKEVVFMLINVLIISEKFSTISSKRKYSDSSRSY